MWAVFLFELSFRDGVGQATGEVPPNLDTRFSLVQNFKN